METPEVEQPDPDPASNADEARFCLLEVLVDARGEAFDYRFLETSPGFDRHAGVSSAVGKTARELVPELPPEWPRVFLQVATTRRASRFHRASVVDGRKLEMTAVPVGLPEQRRVAACVASGNAALTRLADAVFDVLLCDIGLPDMDGYELARRVRGDASLRDVTLIALTGYGQKRDRERARQVGFAAHLTKPVTLEMLEAVLREGPVQASE